MAEKDFFPVTVAHLFGYITNAISEKSITYKTLTVYKSGLRHFMLRSGQDLSPLHDPLVTHLMRSAKKHCKPPMKTTRLPLTVPLLKKCLMAIDRCSVDEMDQGFQRALITYGFASGTRPSTHVLRKVRGVEVFTPMRWRHVKFMHDSVVIHVEKSKTDPFRFGREVVLYDTKGEVNPYADLLHWQRLMRSVGWDDPDDPVFIDPGTRCQITYTAFNNLIKKIVRLAKITSSLRVSTYSLRRGFVTSGYLAGLPIAAVKALCGHASEAYRNYIFVGEATKKNYQQEIFKDRLSVYGWLDEAKVADLRVNDMEKFFAKHKRRGRGWK